MNELGEIIEKPENSKKDDDEMKKSLEVFCGKMVHDICFLTPFFIISPAENLVKFADTDMFICPKCQYMGIKVMVKVLDSHLPRKVLSISRSIETVH